ncbi:MAG: hypothetical protein J4F48_02215, partial [Nitrospinae bacterium]|nr:hypothetical protein [Nitrospinota bacterium]
GFLMESGIRERIRASVRVLHRVMPFVKALFRARAEASPRVLHPAWAAALMDAGAGREMEIIQFPVKLDKFTGFFDKFLEIYRIERKMVILIYSNIYRDKIKQIMSNLSKCIELKNFFAPRICPHFPAWRTRPPGPPGPETGRFSDPARERAPDSYGWGEG